MPNILAIFIASVLWLVAGTYANAEWTPRQKELVNLAGSRYVTKEMHDDFWRDMPDSIKGSVSTQQAFDDYVPQFAKMIDEYQRALWEAIDLSYRQKRVVRTSSLENAEKKFLEVPNNLEKVKAGIRMIGSRRQQNPLLCGI